MSTAPSRMPSQIQWPHLISISTMGSWYIQWRIARPLVYLERVNLPESFLESSGIIRDKVRAASL